VRTSHSLSLIETGEELYRGDEPSPTRSSLLVRCQRSHLRFGTFERLLHLSELEKVPPLLEHIIEHYYPHVQGLGDRYARFYAELVARVARLAAQWMAAGFCHAVLNTDNMAVTGESFDYGPFAFIPTLDPRFTAAYFDHGGRYAYANQPGICLWNLEMLQRPLNKAIAQTEMDSALAQFSPLYQQAYRDCMLAKLGLGELLPNPDTLENVLGSSAASVQLDPGDSAAVEDDQWQMIKLTLQFLQVSQVSYGGFFARLRQTFSPPWWEDAAQILPGDLTDLGGSWATDEAQHLLGQWRSHYHRILTQRAQTEIPEIARRLAAANPLVVPVRPEIEAAWEKITIADDWSGLEDLLARIRA
jgi:serine/tyrosine/threonine adenylyltransferase